MLSDIKGKDFPQLFYTNPMQLLWRTKTFGSANDKLSPRFALSSCGSAQIGFRTKGMVCSYCKSTFSNGILDCQSFFKAELDRNEYSKCKDSSIKKFL